MKHLSKTGVFLLICIPIVLILIGLSTPYLVRLGLQYRLRQEGFKISEFMIQSISLRRTHFTNIHLVRRLPNGTKLTLQIPDIKVSYSLSALRQKQLKDVVITRPFVQLELEKSSGGETQTAEKIIEAVPFKTLNIINGQLKIIAPQLKQPIITKINLNIKNDKLLTGFIKGTIQTKKPIARFQINLQHNLKTKVGQLSVFATSFDFKNAPLELKTLLTTLNSNIELTQGKILINGKLAWNNKPSRNSNELFGLYIQPDIDLVPERLFLNINNTKLESLSGRIKLTKLFPLQSPPGQRITLSTLKQSLPLNNLIANLKVNTQKGYPFAAHIHALQGELAGGMIYIKNIQIGNDQTTKKMQVTVKNIDIEKLLQFSNQKNLQATGKLNGTLPITINKKGIEIRHGLLTSIKNGVIRYKQSKETPIEQQNPTLHSVLKVLSDFYYKNLTIRIDRDTISNETTFKISAYGANPHFYKGHAVKLNLSLSGPLMSIIKNHSFEQEIKIGPTLKLKVRTPKKNNRADND